MSLLVGLLATVLVLVVFFLNNFQRVELCSNPIIHSTLDWIMNALDLFAWLFVVSALLVFIDTLVNLRRQSNVSTLWHILLSASLILFPILIIFAVNVFFLPTAC
jgi:hypothetical protein